ncbi:MAG: hypothetical protein FJZ13_01715 [Candidatus Omnitrophica bacterium]|nr:hypothetical protein [Candidatus Omnitrophota bacterium]
MRKLFLALLFLFCITSVGCAAQEAQPVYLNVASVEVSSFDTTPDWAPLPNVRATVDGSLLTRWSSNYTPGQWITFDFGAPKTLSKIIIFWEQAYAVDYDILISDDNQNWQLLLSLKGQDGNIDETEFASVKARYVKILGTKKVNPDWGISTWEVVLLGPAKDNPGDKPLVGVYPQIAEKLAGIEAPPKEEREEDVGSPGAITPAEFQKGVVYTSWSKTELGSVFSDQTLEYLKELGVRHLGIMVVWFQDEVDQKNIYPDAKDTPDDKALIHAINKAHALGLKVMLKPHVDLKTGQWRGDIIPSAEWFASYKNYILYYAKLASLYNVELFSIGTELVNITTAQWQPQWEGIITEIRKIYSGPLVYSANWNEYAEVGFWDKLDYVGIDAYFALTTEKDPTKEELIAGWKNNAILLDDWLKQSKIDKPVIFTEVGYSSADGTNIQPWSVFSNLSETAVDQEEQADALDAMLAVCTTYSWFKGLYWWNYFPQERWSPLGYTIRGKKAEEVFSEWLKKL